VSTEQIHLERGVALFQQGRWDLAERSLREHLAGQPDDGHGHALLALALLNQDRAREAQREAEAALRAIPSDALAHIAMGGALRNLGRQDEAARHAQEAIALDPSSVDGRLLLASVRFNQRRWSEALDATTEGLSLDPDDAGMQALRARTLTQMGQREEAAVAIEGTLRLDPENPVAHTAQGYAMLHEGRNVDAMESFREALRLEPNSSSARVGMIEAMKGRNPVYAVFLRWFLWMTRLGPRAMVGFVVGWFVLQRVSRLLATTPETSAIGTVALVALLLFAWMTFAASPLFNMILVLDPAGRHALEPDERDEAVLVGGLVVVGAAALLALLVGARELAPIVAVTALGIVIPIHVAFEVRGPIQRGIPILIAMLMAGLGITGAIELAMGEAQGGELLIPIMALAVLSSWLSWPLAARSRPR
jgi:tetratricopeptide (TPR) repeat protein